MIILVVAELLLGVSSAECVKGLRGDPVAIIRVDDQKHFVYFLPEEMAECIRYTEYFKSRITNTLCGCKHTKLPNYPNDVVRLKCLYRTNIGYISKHVARYFYWPESADQCNKLRNKLMLGEPYPKGD